MLDRETTQHSAPRCTGTTGVSSSSPRRGVAGKTFHRIAANTISAWDCQKDNARNRHTALIVEISGASGVASTATWGLLPKCSSGSGHSMLFWDCGNDTFGNRYSTVRWHSRSFRGCRKTTCGRRSVSRDQAIVFVHIIFWNCREKRSSVTAASPSTL